MKYTLLIIALSSMLLSCTKDSTDYSSKQDALTSGTWKLTSEWRDYEKDGAYEEDTYALLADCEKDNIYTFQADGKVIKDEGLSKCISSNPQTVTSSWSFSDQTHLLWGGGNYRIEELTTGILKLKGRISYNYIYTIDVKQTFTKQ